jgi:hypothetical protein
LHKESLIMPLPKLHIQWFEYQIMWQVCLTLCTKRFISSHLHLGFLSGFISFSHWDPTCMSLVLSTPQTLPIPSFIWSPS